MEYQVYKFAFRTSVHFGSGGLTKTQNVFYADTLFSALCIEAVRSGNDALERLVGLVSRNQIRLSDGLPYIQEKLYVPKPVMELKIENEGDSIKKKALKKLSYIPVDQMEEYLCGKMDVKAESDYFHENFGKSSLIEKAVIQREQGAVPYAVNIFTYKNGSGLYILVGYEYEDDLRFIENLLEALSMSGLGGEVSSGYGRFDLYRGVLSDPYQRRLHQENTLYMTLSVSLPDDSEMDGVIKNASFRLIKRSGFVSSVRYADTARKKKDLYVLASGATVTEPYDGIVADVSDAGRHPVYRYEKPMLLGVN